VAQHPQLNASIFRCACHPKGTANMKESEGNNIRRLLLQKDK
jgi:hypothetical protein